jgi:hypothetical protein
LAALAAEAEPDAIALSTANAFIIFLPYGIPLPANEAKQA